VPVPAEVFAAVDALVPREDRDLEAPVLPWLVQANLRREIGRACKATGTALWSPHDLRHRRISLWHRAGESWAQIGEWAGQRDLATTANRYTHVVTGREIDHGALLAAGVPPPVPPRIGKSGPLAG
jgi:integrase